MTEEQQYIANLISQLEQIKGRLSTLENTPAFVRKRKGTEAEYQSLKGQKKQLEEKIKNCSYKSC